MVKIFNHYVSKVASALILIEIFSIILCVYSAEAILQEYGHASGAKAANFFASAAAFSLITSFSMAVFGLYHLDGKSTASTTASRLVMAVMFGYGFATQLFVLVPELEVDGRTLALAAVSATVMIITIRTLTFGTFELSFLESRLLLLGEEALGKECRLAVDFIFPTKYNIVGFIPLERDEYTTASSANIPAGESLFEVAKKHRVNEIIVCAQNRRGSKFPLDQLLECRLNGIRITGAAEFFEREACQIRVNSLYPSRLIFGDGFNQSRFRSARKRLFDVSVSALIFIASLPVMVLTALCIFLEDKGPVIYRQERVGKDGKTFCVLKFRSMRLDAEKSETPQWAAANDSRTTRIGRIIRKLRIDELPQLVNVMKGEMSFVGPRPERPYFVQQLTEKVPYYSMRHSIKPGITGFAQVRYQYGASVEDAIQKLQYDLYYVKNNGMFLDLLILIETMQVVLFAKGSR